MDASRIARGIAHIVLALVLCSGFAVAQTEVSVQLFQPAPNQLKIADLWRIKLVNTTQNTYTVCLFGTLEETAIGKLLVDATTARFTLPPGTKIVSGSEIQPIDANYYDDRYKQIFLRTGQAPAGEYRICVEVRLDCGAQVLGRDCKSARVQPLTPPILISPADQSTVEDRFPTFSWLPPAPLRNQRPTYQLRIVEVLGRQTPYDAMGSNPSWFERANLGPTVLQYPISARPFVPGNRYAWMIKAFSDGFPMGESEIWWFTYAKTTGRGNDGPTIGRGIDSGGVKFIRGTGSGTRRPAFQPITRGTSIVNPDGDVTKVFGSPTLLDTKPAQLYGLDDLKQKQKDLVEVLKELLRSCNE